MILCGVILIQVNDELFFAYAEQRLLYNNSTIW